MSTQSDLDLGQNNATKCNLDLGQFTKMHKCTKAPAIAQTVTLVAGHLRVSRMCTNAQME